MRNFLVALCLIFVSSTIFAQEATPNSVQTVATPEKPSFNNNPLLSPLFVSPAQVYQLVKPQAFGSYSYNDIEGKESADAGKVTGSDSIQKYRLLGSFSPIPEIANFALGLSNESEEGYVKTKPKVGSESKTKFNYSSTFISPSASFGLGKKIKVGLGFDLVSKEGQIKVPGKPTAEPSFDYVVFNRGIMLVDKMYEAGLFFSPMIHIDEDDGLEAKPAILSLHGQYKAKPNINIGGQLAQIQYKNLDDDVYKNAFLIAIAEEVMINKEMMLGSDLRYTTESAKDKESISADNLATVKLSIFGDYIVDNQISVGGNVGYTSGLSKKRKSTVANKAVYTTCSESGYDLSIVGSYLF